MNKNMFKQSPVTFTFLGMIIAYYLYTVIRFGTSMTAIQALQAGAYFPLSVKYYHEYWRLLSSNFIHFGIAHILMNGMSLYNIGPTIELIFGKTRYLILMVSSAICTNFLPYLVYLLILGDSSSYALTIAGGASGIILGLVGGLCCLSVYYKGLFKHYFKGFIPSLVFITLLSVSVPNISLAGHLGGFIGGFITTYLICKIKPYEKWIFVSSSIYNN